MQHGPYSLISLADQERIVRLTNSGNRRELTELLGVKYKHLEFILVHQLSTTT